MYSPITLILIAASDGVQPSKLQVGNKYDSDDEFICAVLKVQQEREDKLSEKEVEKLLIQMTCQTHKIDWAYPFLFLN